MKTNFLLFISAFLVTVSTYSQNTWIVDNNAGATADFTDLQSAINTSVAGDTIYIQQSETNYEDATVNKLLNIVGRSHSENSYTSKMDVMTIAETGSGSFISGLWIDDLYTENSAIITNMKIQNNYLDSVDFSGTSVMNNSFLLGNVINSASDIRMSNSVISHNLFTGAGIIFDFYDITFKNNVILINDYSNATGLNNTTYSAASPNNITVENCILIKATGTADVTNFSSGNDGFVFENCISYNAQGGFVNLPFEGVDTNLNDIDPQFLAVSDAGFNAYTNDYHLLSGSPGINFGNDGLDVGIYNSGYSFNNFGFTNGVPRVSITAITNTVAEGADVEVTIQGNTN
ncbi:hypothetical protein [uncultured Winogradskyella sp.]|uniref:hypothetical protein n=1 Tax=Winogradskyella sp. 4-2091 TaxID=3381659 RepID=UPI002606CB13|nr:hypothetical protein [uncultured Winogradskyella sp.]